jgi:hypothetical protein
MARCANAMSAFADQGKHSSKPHPLHDKSGKAKPSSVFSADDFVVAEDHSYATCPAGKRLYRNGKECNIGGYAAIKFPRTNIRVQGLRAKHAMPAQTRRQQSATSRCAYAQANSDPHTEHAHAHR